MKCGDCYWFDSSISVCRNIHAVSAYNFYLGAGPYSFSRACPRYLRIERVYQTSTTVESSSKTYIVTPYGAREVFE